MNEATVSVERSVTQTATVDLTAFPGLLAAHLRCFEGAPDDDNYPGAYTLFIGWQDGPTFRLHFDGHDGFSSDWVELEDDDDLPDDYDLGMFPDTTTIMPGGPTIANLIETIAGVLRTAAAG